MFYDKDHMGASVLDKWYREMNKKCECGAKHTVNPNCHAEWCILFSKGKFESDSERLGKKK